MLGAFIKKIKENRDIFALAVSCIAVTLSQFPPLHEVFAKANIKIEVKDAITIWTAYDKSGIDVPISIKNVGDKDKIISNIRIELFKKDFTYVKELKASSYLFIESMENPILQNRWEPVKEIPLKPGCVWMYTCSFAFLIPPELYETARQIKYQIEEEVENQEAEWREQLSDKNLSENALEDEIAIRKEKYLVKEALFQKIKEHVTKLNDWLIPGEYYLLFIVTDKEKGRERGIAHAVMEFSITPSIYKSYFNLYLKNGKIFDEVFDWNKKGVPVPIHEITDDTILRQVREKSKYAI